MAGKSCAVFSVDQFGVTDKDLKDIWRNYFGLYGGQSRHPVQIDAQLRPLSTNRAGYLGDHFILMLTDNNADPLELFFKTTPSGIPALAEYLQSIGSARKESKMYRELLPKMRQFSRFAPQCFLATHLDQPLLVLENLYKQGFRTVSSLGTGIFDRKHLECALCALAKFHSASLLLEEKNGKSLSLLAPGLLVENAWVLRENNPRVEELNNSIDVLLALVRVIEKDNPQLQIILQKLPTFIMHIYDLVKPSSNHRNVACHGDLWAGNMMFRYDDRSVPVECLIIDFQFTRYAPPAYDVCMLITLTTTGQTRRAHRDELIRFYYKCIANELRRHAPICCVIEKLFPEESFFKSCDIYRISGLIENFLMNHVTLLPRCYVNKVFSSAECYNNFSGKAKLEMCLEVLRTDDQYRERISGIIKDIIEAL